MGFFGGSHLLLLYLHSPFVRLYHLGTPWLFWGLRGVLRTSDLIGRECVGNVLYVHGSLQYDY